MLKTVSLSLSLDFTFSIISHMTLPDFFHTFLFADIVRRGSHHAGKGNRTYSQCGMVTRISVPNLHRSRYCCTTAGCYFQVWTLVFILLMSWSYMLLTESSVCTPNKHSVCLSICLFKSLSMKKNRYLEYLLPGKKKKCFFLTKVAC